ncbi:MAG: hypothetical protein ABA06_03935 [Parcubacteria bacterium C7867-001]|nr:MAG: hypothetical protein ABA06_03935 [Parcubacteria bacterium C7867-001]
MKKNSTLSLGYFAHNAGIVFGIVIIWRGIWVLLDLFDHTFLGGIHWGSALVGIIIGFIILYLPNRNLKEISNL